jgi:hypothetical protein
MLISTQNSIQLDFTAHSSVVENNGHIEGNGGTQDNRRGAC